MADWIPITAQFDSSCLECLNEVSAGDAVLWCKGTGVKHKVCPEPIQKTHELEAPEDYSKWKDPSVYGYREVHQITNCQKCGTKLLGKDDYLQGTDTGFRAVCEGCI